MKSIVKKIYDRSPRQLYHALRGRFIGSGRLQAFDHGHPCVFVLSTGRAGTETLAELFSLAGNIFAYHEPVPKLYGLSKLAYEHSEDLSARSILREAYHLARKDVLDYSLACGRGYMETSPQVTFLAPVLLEIIPNSRFIHLVRNPQDVVRSGMRRKWYAGNPADETRIVPSQASDVGERWDAFNTFQKNLWLWAETNRWILEFCSTLQPDNTLLVHSEDIFTITPDVLNKLFTFIGVKMPPQRKIMGVLGKKLNAQKSGDFPDASGWTEEMTRDLEMIAGKTARALGYMLPLGS